MSRGIEVKVMQSIHPGITNELLIAATQSL